MEMIDHDLLVVDPEITQQARALAVKRAAAALAWQREKDRQNHINYILEHEPARNLLNARNKAEEAARIALGEAIEPRNKATAAEDAVTIFALGHLADAQRQLDDSIRALSDALAELLRKAQTSASLTATVDGLALRQRYANATAGAAPRWDHTTIPFRALASDPQLDPELSFPVVGTNDYVALRAVLDRLDERVDAIADLVTAESVHQLVQGNPIRAGAALEVAATGGIPDEFEVIRTPTPGHDITHRVLALVDPNLSPAWAATHPGAAATADPVLAAWASRLIPDPKSVRVTVRRIDPASGTAGNQLDLTADVLGLDPLAWAQLAPDPAEVSQRLARAARTSWAASIGEAASTGRVLIDATTGTASSTLTLPDLLAAATAVHNLVSGARALTGADLAKPSATGTTAIDAATAQAVAGRVAQVEQQVNTVISALETAATATDRDALVDALFAASALGEAAGTPQLDTDMPPLETLRAQAAAVLPRLQGRTALPYADDPDDPAGSLTRARDRIAALCGARLPVLTLVPLPGSQPWTTDLYKQEVTLGGAQPAQVRSWLHLHARVRPAVDHLLTAYALAETLRANSVLDVRATQLPDATPEPGTPDFRTWVGAQPAAPAGSVGFVVQRCFADDGPAIPETVTGLAVDTWTQVVPAARHSTGVAFHYDEPDATAPQAVLVAVAPDLRPGRQPVTWDLATLLEVVTSTMALSRDRAVAADDANTSGLTLQDLP